jgi:hypothetical protein
LYQDLEGPLTLTGRKRANDSLNDTESSSFNSSFNQVPTGIKTEASPSGAVSPKRKRSYRDVKQIDFDQERDEIKTLKAQVAALTSENETLKRNMSILFRTAKIELGRIQRAERNRK